MTEPKYGEWQPIATAPDEDYVLVIGGRHERAKVVAADGRWWRMSGLVSTPTHWMPLPTPPKD